VAFNSGKIDPKGVILCVMGAILWFSRFRGDFTFERGDFCGLDYTKILN